MRDFNTIALHSDGRQAARFIRAWHGEDNGRELISIVQLRSGARVRTTVAPVHDILEVLDNGDLDELSYADSMTWNLYHSVGCLTERPPKGFRGGKKYVKWVPGVWLDLDIKEGCFRSREHALRFLDMLPVRPTIALDTGSGGVHAYWRTDKRLNVEQAEELALRWWEYARRLSDVQIDKIQNPDRIMRLPGSVRWPKGDEAPSRAELLWTDGPVTPASWLLELTDEVWKEREKRTQRLRHDLEESRKQAVLSAAAGTGWGLLMAITHIEEIFNETYSWNSILEPLGWTEIGRDNEDRVVWSRPNGHGRKSATTDWPASPHIMSLFSDSDETGLRRLIDAEVPLSKYRVYVELVWGGDEAAFVKTWINQLKQEGAISANGRS